MRPTLKKLIGVCFLVAIPIACREVPNDVVEELDKRGIAVRTANTGQAVAIYNEIAGKESRKIGATFHLTC